MLWCYNLVVMVYPMLGNPFDFQINQDDTPTWPPAGISTLEINDDYVPLFTSATWTIRACVNGQAVFESTPSDVPHTPADVRLWARTMIRQCYCDLRKRGVDADAEYVKWGGSLKDL